MLNDFVSLTGVAGSVGAAATNGCFGTSTTTGAYDHLHVSNSKLLACIFCKDCRDHGPGASCKKWSKNRAPPRYMHTFTAAEAAFREIGVP